jgi:hypothetical protein
MEGQAVAAAAVEVANRHVTSASLGGHAGPSSTTGLGPSGGEVGPAKRPRPAELNGGGVLAPVSSATGAVAPTTMVEGRAHGRGKAGRGCGVLLGRNNGRGQGRSKKKEKALREARRRRKGEREGAQARRENQTA